MATGFLSGMTESWLLCGGECSFIGFNSQGEEVYWNVASDTIRNVFKLICQFVALIGQGDFHFRCLVLTLSRWEFETLMSHQYFDNGLSLTF